MMGCAMGSWWGRSLAFGGVALGESCLLVVAGPSLLVVAR